MASTPPTDQPMTAKARRAAKRAALQTAAPADDVPVTLADDGADEEMIVATLLHDIGDELAPLNHSEYAASILKPYVSKKTHWIIEKHGEFQMYYYAHHLGGNKNKRDEYKNHKYYQDTVNFCEKYDQNSFDPKYKSLSLDFFKPFVKKIFSRKPYSSL